jgi:oligosaccharyltransferase complex subunit epsilon
MAPKRAANAPSAPSPSTSAFSSSASTTLSSGPKTLSANSSVPDIAVHVWQQYLTTTPQRTLLLDAFMAFLVLVGGVQFAYCVLAGNYVCLTTNDFLISFLPVLGTARKS